jgi:hypothetical protein
VLKSSFICSAALAALLASQAALADSYGFKGVTLGSNISLIANNTKFECRSVNTPISDRICSLRKDETDTIAGFEVHGLFYFYDQSSLTGITMSLNEKDFQPVVSALLAKYGTPAHRSQPIKTLAGKTYENIVYRWQQAEQSIEAERYSGQIDTSSIRIFDDAAASRIKQRREQIAKHPQSDL